MSETLTKEKLESILRRVVHDRWVGPPPLLHLPIYVRDFREQWRFPRTKKRRIRRKWAKDPRNWRLVRNKCFRINVPGQPVSLVMGTDVKNKLDQLEANEQKEEPRIPRPVAPGFRGLPQGGDCGG